MALPALQIGLLERLDELEGLLRNDDVVYQHGYAPKQLRDLLIRRPLPDFIDKDRLYDLLGRIIDLAADGLKTRGLGEEKYLAPLYDRIARRETPAETMLNALDNGTSMEDIIQQFAKV